MNDLEQKLTAAEELGKSQPQEALQQLRSFVFDNETSTDVELLKLKDRALQSMSDIMVKQADGNGLRTLLTDLRPMFGSIPKAKTAKIVRMVIDSIAKVPNSTQLQLEVCKEQAAWATAEKRTFLRQRIDVRLAGLYLSTKDYQAALALLSTLLSEVKRLDDKLLLVDIHLLESKTHHALKNLAKSRAALTAARTAANAIYVPPAIQADIDSQSGTLHAEEKDYKTAYSYFFESFEQLSALDDPRAIFVLKYMLLCKIMSSEVSDVPGIIASKGGLKYAGPDVDAMRAVAKAYENRSLHEFQATLQSYAPQLQEDPIVHHHLNALYDMMLQQNLIRIIEPYSRVEIEHIAKQINLPLATVETKLSQMILDRKFAGTLDQGIGVLEIFEQVPEDAVYKSTLETIENMGNVVDSLFARSKKILS